MMRRKRDLIDQQNSYVPISGIHGYARFPKIQ